MSKLPNGWAQTTIGDCQGRTSSIDPRKFPDERFDLYSVPSYTDYRPENMLGREIGSMKQEVREGDVLLCKIVPHIRRGWTVPAATEHRQIASGEWIVLRDHGLEPEYLRRFVLSDGFHEQFMETIAGVGGSLTRARPAEAAKIELPVPPLSEQRRIVAKIDSLAGKSRRAGDHLDHIPRLVEKYKQAILDAAFDGRLTKLKSYQLTFVELGALLQFGPQNGLYLPKDRYGSGVPILRIQNYGLDSVDPIDTWSRVNVSEKMAGQYSLYCGDLVINRVNSPSHLGKSMVVVADMGGALFESNMMRMRLRPGVEPRFVQLYLSSPKGRAALTEGAKWAVNQASINQGDVTGTLLPIPDHDAQIEIVQRIRQAFAWINRLATATTSARKLIDHLDQAVLAKAFKGELLPQDLADEPASVLLDRIRAERAAAPKAKRSRKKTA